MVRHPSRDRCDHRHASVNASGEGDQHGETGGDDCSGGLWGWRGCSACRRHGGRIRINPGSPYNDAAIIAGQGTVALEILDENPGSDTLVVPVGGGGLIAGCAIAAKDIAPDIDIVGIETVMYPSMHTGLFGETGRLTGGVSIADGISVKWPGTLTLPIAKKLVSRIDLVREEGIETAIHLFAEIEKQVVEGAGATGLGAVLAYPDAYAGKRVALVVSGGNIDTRLLSSVFMRGLVRTGRLVRLGVQISDLPGNLARVTDMIAGLGGNIVEVEHERWYRDVPVRMAQIEILVEVRNSGDGHSVAEGLADAGFPTRVLGTEYAPG